LWADIEVFWGAAECVDCIRERFGLELLNLGLECHFNGCIGTLQPKVVNYLHTSPTTLRATSSRDVQTVSSPSRDECSTFGPSASNDTFDVGFSLPHQRTLVSEHEGARATRLHIARRSVTCINIVRRGSNLYIFHFHLLSLEWKASGVIAMCGWVHSAMCGGSMSNADELGHRR
jgi:hypothetical protein